MKRRKIQDEGENGVKNGKAKDEVGSGVTIIWIRCVCIYVVMVRSDAKEKVGKKGVRKK